MDFRSWCLHYFPGGTFSDGGDHYSCKNHLRGEKNGSLSFWNSGRGWKDFGANEHGKISEFCREHGLPEWDGAPEHREERKPLPAPNDRASEARRLWDQGKPVANHPYLTRKGIDGQGCRVTGDGTLLVPACTPSGDVVGVERIDAAGSKKHLGTKGGAFFPCGDVKNGKTVFVCEGMATAKSIHAITGFPALAAFGAVNLLGAAQSLRGREVLICPDADDAGRKTAAQCRAAGFRVVELPPESRNGLDWNDVHVEQGIEPAKALFREAWSRAQAEKTMVREEKNSSSFILRRIGDLQLMEPEFLVDDLFEADALCLFFGESGCKKSFVALDMAASIATGAPFYGKQTKEGPVIYLAGEGIGGMTRRREAWTKHRGISLSGAPLFLSNRAALFMDEQSARIVEEEVEKAAQEVGNPLLIIIDTVARSIVGGDENSAKDVSVFIDRVDALRRKYGASALLVHHSGIMDKGRLRGSSAWKGALDAEFLIEASGPENMLVTVSCKKMKDAPIPAPFSFEAVEYVVMETRTGKAITSLALEPTDEKPAKVEKMSRAQKTALDTYHAAAKEKPTVDQEGNFLGVHVEDWRDYFYSASTADSAEGKKKAYQRARNDLVTLNVLTVKDDLYSPVRSEDSILTTDYAKKIRGISNQDTGTSGQNENVPVCLAATEPQEEGRLFAEGTEKSSGQPGQSGTLSRNVPAANYTKRDNRDIILRDVPCPGSLSRTEGEEKNTSLPRGVHSVSELATRAGVPVEALREELSRWESCGRVSVDDDGTIHLLAGTSYPGQDEPEPEEEDTPPAGPGQVGLFPDEPEPLSLDALEAWAASFPGMTARLKARAKREKVPYETILRREYVSSRQGGASPGQGVLSFDEEPPAPTTPPKENPFLKIAEEDDDDEG